MHSVSPQGSPFSDSGACVVVRVCILLISQKDYLINDDNQRCLCRGHDCGVPHCQIAVLVKILIACGDYDHTDASTLE